ncbi:MAG: ATP-binding protein [Spirochaetia bacterium]
MLEELEIHNQFRESPTRFKNHDPHLRKLKSFTYVYESKLLDEPAFLQPGIYLITGGRQIGKTTFLKQLISKWLNEERLSPDNIFFLTGELIDTHHVLRRVINSFFKPDQKQVLFIDEVNYIPDWDKTIKFVADAGVTDSMSIILTGSDNQIIKTSMKRFAGRRGMEDTVDFEYFPLNFLETAALIRPKDEKTYRTIAESPLTGDNTLYLEHHETLLDMFSNYLAHGGFLPAINAFYSSPEIPKAVFNTYTHWIVGDFLKYNKSENYLSEVLKGIIKTYGSQISWIALSKHLSIEHHKTVSDYCRILESMNVLHIQEAVLEDKMTAAPKKNKKLYFRDPFIAHAVSTYIENTDYNSILHSLKSPEYVSSLVESICVDHCKRHFPTYYISGKKGEVDLAVLLGNKLLPAEVKWTSQLRPEELKQISLYKNGLVLQKSGQMRTVGNNITVPLLHFLLQLSTGTIRV